MLKRFSYSFPIVLFLSVLMFQAAEAGFLDGLKEGFEKIKEGTIETFEEVKESITDSDKEKPLGSEKEAKGAKSTSQSPSIGKPDFNNREAVVADVTRMRNACSVEDFMLGWFRKCKKGCENSLNALKNPRYGKADRASTWKLCNRLHSDAFEFQKNQRDALFARIQQSEGAQAWYQSCMGNFQTRETYNCACMAGMYVGQEEHASSQNKGEFKLDESVLVHMKQTCPQSELNRTRQHEEMGGQQPPGMFTSVESSHTSSEIMQEGPASEGGPPFSSGELQQIYEECESNHDMSIKYDCGCFANKYSEIKKPGEEFNSSEAIMYLTTGNTTSNCIDTRKVEMQKEAQCLTGPQGALSQVPEEAKKDYCQCEAYYHGKVANGTAGEIGYNRCSQLYVPALRSAMQGMDKDLDKWKQGLDRWKQGYLRQDNPSLPSSKVGHLKITEFAAPDGFLPFKLPTFEGIYIRGVHGGVLPEQITHSEKMLAMGHYKWSILFQLWSLPERLTYEDPQQMEKVVEILFRKTLSDGNLYPGLPWWGAGNEFEKADAYKIFQSTYEKTLRNWAEGLSKEMWSVTTINLGEYDRNQGGFPLGSGLLKDVLSIKVYDALTTSGNYFVFPEGFESPKFWKLSEDDAKLFLATHPQRMVYLAGKFRLNHPTKNPPTHGSSVVPLDIVLYGDNGLTEKLADFPELLEQVAAQKQANTNKEALVSDFATSPSKEQCDKHLAETALPPDLKKFTIQSVGLGMTAETVHNLLRCQGYDLLLPRWAATMDDYLKKFDRPADMFDTPKLGYKKDSEGGGQFTMHLEFTDMHIKTGARLLEEIHYKQQFPESTAPDWETLKNKIMATFGEPSRKPRRGRTHFRYHEDGGQYGSVVLDVKGGDLERNGSYRLSLKGNFKEFVNKENALFQDGQKPKASIDF